MSNREWEIADEPEKMRQAEREIASQPKEMSRTECEIASQPEMWERARALLGTASPALPEHGARVAVIGCGTSYYLAQSYAAAREAAGLGETDAFPASELPGARTYDTVLALSRSGTTTEVLRALESPIAGRTVAIIAVADSPLAAAVDDAVVLDFADEESVVQTRFATSVLALLRAHLGEPLDQAISDARTALSSDEPVQLARRHEHFVTLGTGWTVGLASEAALKLREAAGAWAEAYPAMEYRHGPISAAGPRTLVSFIGGSPDGLAGEIRETGADVIAPELDPMATLVLLQRTAVALALERDLDPDRPRHLARSVVLS